MNASMLSRMILIALVAGLLSADSVARAGTNQSTRLPAPLFNDLGHYHHPITTKSKLAQRYFDQGLILVYGFNHAEAIRSFEGAAKTDPDCAMAYWGIAYAYGPNINVPMDDKAVPKAWEALQQAMTLRVKASKKEQAYIDALAKRYAPEPVKDRAPLDQQYAQAMGEVARQFPEDLDAQTLLAEALMDTSPWNYWQADLTPKPNAAQALQVIESVLSRVRRHPGADHLYIHLVEAGPHPEKGVPSADRLGKFAPGAGHLVHMPSHIYVRVGRYHDAATANVRASLADESYLSQCKQQGAYPGAYYPHNVHFLWFATALEGRSHDSIHAAKKVSAYTTELRCGALEGPRQRYLPLLAFARFGRWDDILNSPTPGADYPFDSVMWHYARGIALAAKGQANQAAQEYTELVELAKSDQVRAMENPHFPATKILAIADEVLAGKVAGARAAQDEMLRHLHKAVALQDAISYMEPPYWYYPSRLSLGAALLKTSQPAEAEKVFRDDLKEFPENGWTLFGLEQSLRQQDKTSEANQVRRRFEKAWKHADVQPELAWY